MKLIALMLNKSSSACYLLPPESLYPRTKGLLQTTCRSEASLSVISDLTTENRGSKQILKTLDSQDKGHL